MDDPRSRSRPFVAAGALFWDEAGRTMLVRPNYKDGARSERQTLSRARAPGRRVALRLRGQIKQSLKSAEECRVGRTCPVAMYDYPADHQLHLRTTHPPEPTLVTTRHGNKFTRGPGSRGA